MQISISSLGVKWDSETYKAVNRLGDVLFTETDPVWADDTFINWAKTYQRQLRENGWDHVAAVRYCENAFGIKLP